MSQKQMTEKPASEVSVLPPTAAEWAISVSPMDKDSTLTEELASEHSLVEQLQPEEVLAKSPVESLVLDQALGSAPQVTQTSKDALTFDKIPAEMRLKIWSFTENMQLPPRWFAVAPLVDDNENEAPLLTVMDDEEYHSQRRGFPVAAMSTCHESREEALKINELNGKPEKYRVYVNPLKDIHYFGNGWVSLNNYATHRIETKSNESPDGQSITSLNINLSNFPHGKNPVIFDTNDLVFNTVQHLAIDFELMTGSEDEELEEFFRGIAKFHGVNDLTIVLPEGKIKDMIYPFFPNSYFSELQTKLFQKMSGLVQPCVANLLEKYLPNCSWRPAIKIVFHKEHKSDFLGHTDSYNQGIPYSDETEAETRQKWEDEWSNKVWDAWKKDLQSLDRQIRDIAST